MKMLKTLKKIYRYFLCYIQIRCSIIRPKYVVLLGKNRISLTTIVYFNKNSNIEFRNVKLKSSKLIITNSRVVFQGDSILKYSEIIIRDSYLSVASNSKFLSSKIFLTNSTIELGNFFFNECHGSNKSKINITNSKFVTGNNISLKCILKISNAHMIIGDNVFINDNTEIRCENNIVIGNNVFISYECIVFDTNTHSVNYLDRRKEIELGFPNSTIQTHDILPITKPINIGNDVWIGQRAIILKGSIIAERSIVAAGAVITKFIPADSIAYGNPAIVKQIK